MARNAALRASAGIDADPHCESLGRRQRNGRLADAAQKEVIHDYPQLVEAHGFHPARILHERRRVLLPMKPHPNFKTVCHATSAFHAWFERSTGVRWRPAPGYARRGVAGPAFKASR